MESPLLMLLIVLAAATLFGEIAKRIGIPAVVGQIAAGLLLSAGPIKQLIFTDNNLEALSFLSNLGVILLFYYIGLKTDFKNPEVIFFIYIFEDQGFFGIDLAGIDLSKRDYNIFPHQNTLKGTISYALLRIADYKKEDALLDPFARSGNIPIEAAFFAKKISPNNYRKNELAFSKFAGLEEEMNEKENSRETRIFAVDSQMNSIRAAEKNAKIAGVKKDVQFSRMDIDWLDTKFKKGQIDKIVTLLPSITRRIDEGKITKIYNEFLYQGDYILNSKGMIVAVTRSPEKLIETAAKYGFHAKQRSVWSGQEELPIVALQK